MHTTTSLVTHYSTIIWLKQMDDNDDIPVLYDVIKKGDEDVINASHEDEHDIIEVKSDHKDQTPEEKDSDTPVVNSKDIDQLVMSISVKLLPEIKEFIKKRIEIELESYTKSSKKKK